MRLGGVLGIPIRIHYTFWLVFALIAWSLASGYMPEQYPGLTTITYWLIGVVAAIILFSSVLIHELSHSYVAKRNGLQVAQITLFFFGGVSEIVEEPNSPGFEIRMALAGPLMSFLLSGVLGALWYLTTVLGAPIEATAVLGYSALINGALGAFNLLPAFPLDGGRVLRGSIWKHTKDLISATRIATKISSGLAVLAIAAGILIVVSGSLVNGVWIIMLGWFIRSGASSSMQQTLIEKALSGLRTEDVMNRTQSTVPPDITVQQLISNYFLTSPDYSYPVVKNGAVVGVVTAKHTREVLRDGGMSETVEKVMVPLEQVLTAKPDDTALNTMRRMVRGSVDGALVLGDERQLLGTVTRRNLIRAVQERQQAGLTQLPVQLPSSGEQVKNCVQCGAPLPVDARFCAHCAAQQ